MAVRMVGIQQRNAESGKVIATVVADTKVEVTDELTVGDYELGFGSTALTVAGDIAICDSEGAWHWLEE